MQADHDAPNGAAVRHHHRRTKRTLSDVILEQGLEMLSILKKHDSNLSILDDFEFYEDRQKSMQERKARQQHQPSPSFNAVDVRQIPGSRSSDLITQISKNFSLAVRLENVDAGEATTADKGNTAVANSGDPKMSASPTTA